jgi:hypothetical protein
MNTMYRWLRILLLSLGVLSICVACATRPNDAPPNSVARISEVIGPQATLNGRPARVGDYLLPGDRVATGARSYLEVKFRQGGFMQLDQSTDPWLEEKWEAVKAGSCQVVSVLFGRVFFIGDNLCIKDPNLGGIMRSQIVLTSDRSRSEVVVHYGSFEVTTTRGVILVKAGQGLVIERGGTAQVRARTTDELDASLRWRAVFYGGNVRAVVPDRTGGNTAPADTPADPAVVGYCCLTHEVFGSSRGVCEQRKGRFFAKREEAQVACLP